MNAKWLAAIGFGSIAAAVIGFVGGVLGQYYSAQQAARLERYKTVASLRSATYVDFFSAQAKLQQARAHGFDNYGQWLSVKQEESGGSSDPMFAQLGQLLWDYELATKAARMKLAAFAPTEVVEALSDYYRDNHLPQSNTCHANWRADARTYAAMRGDLLEGLESRSVDQRKLYLLMWNCRPPSEN
jgi:hypothetical protein